MRSIRWLALSVPALTFVSGLYGQAVSFTPKFSFEENRGQAGNSVRFLAHSGSLRLFLRDDAAVMTSAEDPQDFTMRLLGANRAPQITPLEPQSSVSNYLRGRDPANWITGVKQFGRIRYQRVYPGIDLVYYGNGTHLEHDFVVAPGADLGQIKLHFDGAKSVSITASGDLVVQTKHGELREPKPVIYQMIAGRQQRVEGGYRLKGREVNFEVGPYNSGAQLVIDPAFVYFSTYLGGSGIDQPTSIAIDPQGNAYTTGNTTSVDFPLKGAAQSKPGGKTDVFVTKMDGNTGAIIYSTYIGGSGDDFPARIKVDQSGNAYVAGSTASSDFPTTMSAFRTALNGTSDAFVLKLNPAGNGLVYSTYLGGSDDEVARTLDIDPAGAAYVAGITFSGDFPTSTSLFGRNFGGGLSDGFITKLNAAGTNLIYSAYFGGNGVDCVLDIAVNTLGEVNMVGFTTSTDLPTTFEDSRWPNPSGGMDGFQAKVSSNGFVLNYISYVGGSNDDMLTRVILDPSDAVTVYIAGITTSPDFPTATGAAVPVGANQAIPFATKFALPGEGGAAGNQFEFRSRAARTAQIDDYSWYVPFPDDCQNDSWLPTIQNIKGDFTKAQKKQLQGLLNDLANIGFDFVPKWITVPKDVMIFLKDVSDLCSGKLPSNNSSTPSAAQPEATTPTPQPLAAVSAFDGSPAPASEPPISSAGNSTAVWGLVAGPAGSGTIYLALRTTDKTFPVSAQGVNPGTAQTTGYVTKISSAPPNTGVASVTNAASFSASPVAAGQLITLFGQFPSTTTATAASLPLPTSLGSTSVTVNGSLIPLYFVNSSQINAQLPWQTAPGPANVVVTSGSVVSASLSFTVAPTSPGIFSFGANRAVAQNQDFSLNDANNPAAVGSVITVYMTGGGAVDNAIATGVASPSSPLSRVTATTSATIGGQAASILFLGMVPGLVGVVQANVQVPALAAGTYPIVISLGGLQSNAALVSVH